MAFSRSKTRHFDCGTTVALAASISFTITRQTPHIRLLSVVGTLELTHPHQQKYFFNPAKNVEVWERQGHHNPDFASEKKGYWYEPVEGGPKDLRFKFLDKDNKVIYEKVYKGCTRYRTLPEHLQHKWKEVFKRIVFDEETGEMVDEKLKTGARSSEVEDFRGDYLKHEVYTNDAHSFIGFEPTCPRPSSVVRIETRNAHNNAIIRIVDDKKIIDHACSKKLGCTVCRKLLKGKIEGGARDIITTFVYTAGGEVEPPDHLNARPPLPPAPTAL